MHEKATEEANKNLISNFLKNTWYTNHYINAVGKIDLAIYSGKDAKSNMGVMLECKSLANKTEMVTPNDINRKAMQELLLYYLRERHLAGNIHIHHLIITDGLQWFIFDEKEFEKAFASNTKLISDFKGWKASGKSTDVFYKTVAPKYIAAINWKEGENFTYFDLEDFRSAVNGHDLAADTKLSILYKLL